MPRGLFVSFEGSEGCGKPTQIRLLADCLKSAGQAVRAGSLVLARDNPARVRLLDAAGSIDHLAERIWPEISPRLA